MDPDLFWTWQYEMEGGERPVISGEVGHTVGQAVPHGCFSLLQQIKNKKVTIIRQTF